MPELPEVETIKNDLSRKITGRKIHQVEVLDARILRNRTKAAFIKDLTGRQILGLERRGKALILTLDNGVFLVIQLMMTGQLVFHPARQADPATKIIFELSKRSYLNYNDQRLFGRLNLVRDLQEIPYFASIGPEPFSADFTYDWLNSALIDRKIPIKIFLLNHQFVAGIGNIYASEILFRSRIHPRRAARTLTPPEIRRLHQNIRKVLKEAIEFRGTTMINYVDGRGKKGSFVDRLRVYSRAEESCVRCKSSIERIRQGGRSTFFCKRCQT